MDRLISRGEISEREVTLSRTAAAAGVESYPRFQNAGYRGMYNMDLADLKRVKQMPDPTRTLFDFMGKDELAANLFRLTLTEGRIKREGTRGQSNLEHVAQDVGRKVRNTMIDETGIRPEVLPIAPDMKLVKKGLKGTTRSFAAMDDLSTQRDNEKAFLASIAEAPNKRLFPGVPRMHRWRILPFGIT